MNQSPEDPPRKSKSQVKRELLALQDLGRHLLALGDEQIAEVADERLREALREGRRLRPGNAAKRQIQYIGKLLRSLDTTDLEGLVERAQGRSRAQDAQLHRLERWRSALLAGDPAAPGEIQAACPNADLRHLRALARGAAEESARDPANRRLSRRLFQELRSLLEDAGVP
jgi:ribosome-associated protein